MLLDILVGSPTPMQIFCAIEESLAPIGRISYINIPRGWGWFIFLVIGCHGLMRLESPNGGLSGDIQRLIMCCGRQCQAWTENSPEAALYIQHCFWNKWLLGLLNPLPPHLLLPATGLASPSANSPPFPPHWHLFIANGLYPTFTQTLSWTG